MNKYDYKYRCVEKVRNQSGKITGYGLFDYYTDEMVIRTVSFVKEFLRAYPEQIENLKLTSDGRIVDKRVKLNNWKEILEHTIANQKPPYHNSSVTYNTEDYKAFMNQIHKLKNTHLILTRRGDNQNRRSVRFNITDTKK